jgi:hypothetical protein
VHGHGSFDFTELRPVWLAVAVFVALALQYGLAVPAVVDALNGWALRGPDWLVVLLGVAVLVQPPTMVAALAYGGAVLIATTAPLNRWWRGRSITVAGTALFAVLVAWGLCGLAVDITSLATATPPTAPFKP